LFSTAQGWRNSFALVNPHESGEPDTRPESKGREYLLIRPPASVSSEQRQRIVPSRPRRSLGNLRLGGGRQSKTGWTEQKRRTNRQRLNELRPWIRSALTVVFPGTATSKALKRVNDLLRNFCREKHLPARCVWEGPGFHCHIALGILHDGDMERLLLRRLSKKWKAIFGEDACMTDKTLLWRAHEDPDRIASYLLKTRKNGALVKGEWPWMIFTPSWETNFRRLCPCKRGPDSLRKISEVCEGATV
jgi:hypothetical protein